MSFSQKQDQTSQKKRKKQERQRKDHKKRKKKSQPEYTCQTQPHVPAEKDD